MQCPNCGNELAFLAEACPNCGQPGFGSVLNQQHLTPKQQADAAFGMILLIAGLIGLAVLAGVGYLVVGAASYWSTWATESPVVQNLVHGGITFVKWVVILAAAFLPFGIITGLITNSTQGVFLDGYLWGQFTGPIGLIVAIFQIPDKPQAGASHTRTATASSHKVVKTKGFEVLVRFVCPHCEKRYKVEETALGKRFDCGGCGHSSIVTRHVKNA